MPRFISLLSKLRLLAILGAAAFGFTVVDDHWEDFAIWVYGEFPNNWVVDNLVLIPSWWPATVIALALVGVLVVWRNLWLNHQLVPKISISEPKQYFLPWREADQGNRVNRYYYLTITNNSFGNIENCSVQDARFENIEGHVAPVTGRHFRLRSERGADTASHTYARSVDLRGKGNEFDVDICSLDEGQENSRVIMYYATSPTQKYPNELRRELFPHFLTVRVSAANMARPETRKFKILIADNGDLKMETAEDAARYVIGRRRLPVFATHSIFRRVWPFA